jgi:hypothetical protein
MVLRQTRADDIGEGALDEFDDITHMGFSDDTSAESSSSDTLTGEFLRKALSIIDKDTGALTYEWDGVLGLTEANGETLQKFGLFTNLAGNTLKLSKLLETAVAKTSDREINVGYQLAVEVIDQTG